MTAGCAMPGTIARCRLCDSAGPDDFAVKSRRTSTEKPIRTACSASRKDATHMYQAHWGLHESPFAGGLDRAKFYRSPTHDEALARLHFLVDEHRRLGLLLGAAGSGKSLVLEVLAHEARREAKDVVRINLLAVGEHEFLWQLAEGLGQFPCRGESIRGLWRGISDTLAERRCQHVQTIVLLD